MSLSEGGLQAGLVLSLPAAATRTADLLAERIDAGTATPATATVGAQA